MQQLQAAEQEALVVRCATAEQQFEERWQRRQEQVQQEYQGWLAQETVSIKAQSQAAEQTEADQRDTRLTERETTLHQELISLHPVQHAVRLILQHGVMTLQDLFHGLPPTVSHKKFRREFNAHLETLEMEGLPVILTELTDDGPPRYFRNPQLSRNARVGA